MLLRHVSNAKRKCWPRIVLHSNEGVSKNTVISWSSLHEWRSRLFNIFTVSIRNIQQCAAELPAYGEKSRGKRNLIWYELLVIVILFFNSTAALTKWKAIVQLRSVCETMLVGTNYFGWTYWNHCHIYGTTFSCTLSSLLVHLSDEDSFNLIQLTSNSAEQFASANYQNLLM